MGPKLSTAATDINFARICKQLQDLHVIGTGLSLRTKWTRICSGMLGYLNTAN